MLFSMLDDCGSTCRFDTTDGTGSRVHESSQTAMEETREWWWYGVQVGVSLALSVIPEGLVAIVTLTMALGM